MNLNEIEIEEQKWKDENFQKNVQDKLCQYVGNLDEILQKRYRDRIKNLSQDDKNRAVGCLKARNLFDENLEYIGDSNIVRMDSNANVANGGYYMGEILVNPNSAEQFYSAYKDFLQGKTEGIRKLDYAKPLDELEGASALETLYWFYTNGKTYEEFLKSTMLHEDIHRWTLAADIFDDPIDIFTAEGLVETEAREIAKENGIEYANCFRNDEINLINFFSQYNIVDRTDMMLCYTPDTCLLAMINMSTFGILKGISGQEAGKIGREIYAKLNTFYPNEKQNSVGKNYREIFANIKPKKSCEIIEFIQSELKNVKEHNLIDSGVKATEQSTTTGNIVTQKQTIIQEQTNEQDRSKQDDIIPQQ